MIIQVETWLEVTKSFIFYSLNLCFYESPAPCDPANVTASLNCLSDAATVTWSASAGANFYTVVAEASGLVDSCISTATSCELTRLQCGENYTVTVLAGDAKCNSSILAKTNIITGDIFTIKTIFLIFRVLHLLKTLSFIL